MFPLGRKRSERNRDDRQVYKVVLAVSRSPVEGGKAWGFGDGKERAIMAPPCEWT